MDTVLLNHKSEIAIKSYISNPSMPLLLFGPKNIGKKYVAQAIISELLDIKHKPENKNYVHTLESTNNSIGVDQIRDLKKKLSLSSTGSQIINRGAIINQAELLTLESQNALLKLLEEVPHNTAIILTCDKPSSLLNTIVSRVQKIEILPVSDKEMMEFFDQKSNTNDESVKFLAISQGRPALFTNLISGEDGSLQNVKQAKEFIQSDKYSRLNYINELSKSEKLNEFFEAMMIICKVALDAQTQKGDKKSLTDWGRRCTLIDKIIDMHSQKISSKLLLTILAVSL